MYYIWTKNQITQYAKCNSGVNVVDYSVSAPVCLYFLSIWSLGRVEIWNFACVSAAPMSCFLQLTEKQKTAAESPNFTVLHHIKRSQINFTK